MAVIARCLSHDPRKWHPVFPKEHAAPHLARAAQHFSSSKQCKSHGVRMPCLVEIVMFLLPSPENVEICPQNMISSHALKHGFFDDDP
jgi:hypothetical protein